MFALQILLLVIALLTCFIEKHHILSLVIIILACITISLEIIL